MKKTTKLKAFALSLAMAFGMLLPMTTNAQSDGFFRGSMESYENRDAGINSNDGTGITNYGIGEQVPLGSGLLILAAAGAGYAALRRKRNKKGFVMIIALAMIVTMSNCKKKVETINSVAENGVKITLTVDDGSKVNVDPIGGTTYATVNFEEGDVIYVGNNGHYCGYLQHNGTYFIGSISETNLSTADYLHFYFMGNKGTTSQPVSVNITDQTSKYPVISYAHSDDLYYGAGSYSAKLQNYCAIAKFPLSGAGTTNAVYVRGMNNTVTVHFDANIGATTGDPYTFSKEGNGTIKLHSENATEKWAIVLEQSAVTADLLADGFEVTTVNVPTIERNTYHASDISSASLTAGSKVCYSFTVDENGSVVRFSQGNLQAVFTAVNVTTKTWRFAANQYDYVGNATANTAVQSDRVKQAGTVDLFGWVGEHASMPAYGISNNTNSRNYGNTVNEALKDDWGNVAISNGGNTQNSGWRTLTKDEWQYIFYHSTKEWSTVAGVNGYVLRPDGNTTAVASSYTADEWATVEASGSVFLPAAGSRYGTDVYGVGDGGYYWSSTAVGGRDAWLVYFGEDEANMYGSSRADGLSVRLVR